MVLNQLARSLHLEGQYFLIKIIYPSWNVDFVTSMPLLESSSSNVTTKGSSFNSNSATDHAGGIFSFNSTIFIYGSYFENNTAIGGGAVTTVLSIITVAGSVFTLNRARQHGGALDIGMNIGMDIATISGCHFERNVAYSFAGAVFLWLSTCRMYGKAILEEALQACDESCSHSYQEHAGPGMNDTSEFSLGDKTRFIANSAPTGAALYVTGSTLKRCGPIYFSKILPLLTQMSTFLTLMGILRVLLN